MLSLEYIVRENNKATRRAKKEGKIPYIARYNGDEYVKTCEKFGNYIPKGWQKINTYFVDNSGFGSESETALTFGNFLTKVKEGYGYAIGEMGEFQVYIHEYKRI